jgi:D-alanine-D-alanine ligase-like ATP-grasp enzyme
LLALERGATHLWANTILFASHPLQNSTGIGKYQDAVKVVGQPPLMVEKYDNKEFVNNLLRSKGGFIMPRCWSLSKSEDVDSSIKSLNLPFPIVAKPIRGRGSYGVKVCHSEKELIVHIEFLFKDSPSIIIEEFLEGEEATVSVMAPSEEIPKYWAMPIVTRFNHVNGIAPYNGTVAVTANSRVVSRDKYAEDPAYDEARRQCEEVAQLLRVTAPIRIDIRRFKNGASSRFALFDINMKPVRFSMTISFLTPWPACDPSADFLEHDRSWPAWSRKSGQPHRIVSCGTGMGLSKAP